MPPPHPAPLSVTIHYDFASTLCYVAHRIVERMEGFLGDLGVETQWSPLDLAPMMRWTRGMALDPGRRVHVEQIAEALAVPVTVPRRWLDSRPAAAIVLALESEPARAASWRERVYSCIHEEGLHCDAPDVLRRMQRELGVAYTETDLAPWLAELERRTRAAAQAMVTGVPTFMLGPWPFGGIQEEATMRSLLRRWAERQRRDDDADSTPGSTSAATTPATRHGKPGSGSC